MRVMMEHSRWPIAFRVQSIAHKWHRGVREMAAIRSADSHAWADFFDPNEQMCLAAAQLGDAHLAAQAVQHDADLLFGRVAFARRPADALDDLFG